MIFSFFKCKFFCQEAVVLTVALKSIKMPPWSFQPRRCAKLNVKKSQTSKILLKENISIQNKTSTFIADMHVSKRVKKEQKECAQYLNSHVEITCVTYHLLPSRPLEGTGGIF